MTKFKRDIFPTEKTNALHEYGELFKHARAAFLVRYEGLKVEDLTKFRRNLDKLGSSLKVVKNRLAKLAVEGTPFEKFKDDLKTGTAIVTGTQDPLPTVKLVTKAGDEFPQLKLLAGIFAEGGAYYDFKSLVALSKLPPKEQLIAQILFLLNAPITSFARTLNEVPASFVRALNQIATKEA